MTQLNRQILLTTLVAHETLSVENMSKEEVMGFTPDVNHLKFLLGELKESGHIQTLNGVTYTVTLKGIEEGERLKMKL
jgi:hypothetical protein